MEIKDFNWYKLGLIFGLLLLFIATPALAASDIVGTAGSINHTTYDTSSHFEWASFTNITSINVDDIENVKAPYQLSATSSAATAVTTTATAGSRSVGFYDGATSLGTGTISYTKTTVPYLVTVNLVFNTFTPGLRQGHYILNFTTPSAMPTWDVGGLKACLGQDPVSDDSIGFNAGGVGYSGGDNTTPFLYNFYQYSTFFNSYDTADGGSGITNIVVGKNVSGTLYGSRAYVFSPSYLGGATALSDEGAYTTTDYSGTYFYTPIQICIFDRFNRWWNSSLISGATALGYGIQLSPSSITTTTTSTASITSTSDPLLSAVTDISWKWSDETGTYNFNDGGNVSRLLDYTKKSNNNWYGYEIGAGGLGGSYNLNKGTNVPSPVTLANIPTTGNKTITCFIGTSTGNWYTLTAPLTVGGGGGGAYVTTRAAMVDWMTGNRIYYGTISFQNIATGIWTNITPSTGDGSVAASSTPMTMWDIYGSASGYANANRLGVPATSTGVYTLFMYPQANITAALGQTTLYVTVEDDSTLAGISGAHVTVSTVADQTYLSLKSTASSGVATFYVPNNTEFWVGAQADGYMGNVQKISIALEPLFSYHLALHLKTAPTAPVPTIPPGVQQPGGVPGVTIAPGQTYAPNVTYTWAPTQTYITPRPTTTVPGYQPATGNFTGFWAPFLNLGVAMGADPSEVGILMALILSLAGLIVGSIGPSMFTGMVVFSPVGGEIGAILGVAGSIAFGFFPFAIAIIVTCALVLYVSLRVWGAAH